MLMENQWVLNFKDLAVDNHIVGSRNAVAIPDLGIAIAVVEQGEHIVYDLDYNLVATSDPKGVRVYGDSIKAFWTYDIYCYLLFDDAIIELHNDEEYMGGVEIHYKDGREANASWIVGKASAEPVFFGMVEGDRSKWHKDFF